MIFTVGERQCLRECFEALLPPEAAALPLDAFIVALERAAPNRVRWGLRGLMLFVRWRARRTGRPWWLRTQAERTTLFEEMRASERYLVRETPLMFKALGSFAAFGHPDTQRAFGLPVDASPPAWGHVDSGGPAKRIPRPEEIELLDENAPRRVVGYNRPRPGGRGTG